MRITSMADAASIRNFCIIAHIDHGKSTLADRLLEATGTVAKREMQEQLLDQMDLERERGITIKLAPVRMVYTRNLADRTQTIADNNAESRLLHEELTYKIRGAISASLQQKSAFSQPESAYILNLIDTPGHVDFTYEVSRSLAAVEGAILLVDATQGIQAQTIANLYLALEQNLAIVPAVNKIDLPAARVEETVAEVAKLVGCASEEILHVSAKTGEGVSTLLEAVVERIPPPTLRTTRYALRALIFDSIYDDYRGVIAYVRVVDGEVRASDRIRMMSTGAESEVIEVGYFTPKLKPAPLLGAGEIGYIVTGLKDIKAVSVGDTITIGNFANLHIGKLEPLPGYKKAAPMVFAGLFPKQTHEHGKLREAIEKLKLNDAALDFTPERSTALGPGFRLGLLGLLHLEIVQERLKREHRVEVILTVPSVGYHVFLSSRASMPRAMVEGRDPLEIKSAAQLPNPSEIDHIEEPWVRVDIVTPKSYVGEVLQMVADHHGIYKNTEYLGEDRAILHFELPLAAIVVDFYDKLKSVSSGFASMSYEFLEYREADVVRLEVLVAEEPVEALSTLVYRDAAERIGRHIVETLKEKIPRQMFEVKLQAAVGGRVLASERIPAMRKDMLARMSGGDVTRKMKLLKKQKEGKKRMMAHGRGTVEIPPEAYLAVLKR